MKFQFRDITIKLKYQAIRTALLSAAVIIFIQLLTVSAPAETGKIAYSRGNSIYKMNQDGSGTPVQLTFPASNEKDYSPVFSRNGAKIAFVRSSAYLVSGPNETMDTIFNYKIYAIDYDGGNPIMVRNSATFINDITWSPDGIRIAYVEGADTTFEGRAYQCSAGSYIYVSYVSGLGYTNQISATLYGTDPSWSPDGTKIYFASNANQKYGIYSVNLQTNAVDRLTYNDFAVADPEVSPDGTQIAYAVGYHEENGCLAGNMSTIQPKILSDYGGTLTIYNISTNSSKGLIGNVSDPVWSPAGNLILFVNGVNVYEDGLELFTIDATDGSNLSQLPNIESNETAASWSN